MEHVQRMILLGAIYLETIIGVEGGWACSASPTMAQRFLIQEEDCRVGQRCYTALVHEYIINECVYTNFYTEFR